jgi:nicotinate dehydrogenase subunit A
MIRANGAVRKTAWLRAKPVARMRRGRHTARTARSRAHLSASMPTYRLIVNEQPRSIESSDPGQPLLYVLRNSLGLHGPKYGCGLGQCGACTVLLDGTAVRSCTLAVSQVGERRITTLEGLGTPEQPHPVQAAFIAEQAAQCGYCANGMVMTTVALLKRTAKPSEDEARAALDGCLCRCGTHVRVLRAVMRAAKGAPA